MIAEIRLTDSSDERRVMSDGEQRLDNRDHIAVMNEYRDQILDNRDRYLRIDNKEISDK